MFKKIIELQKDNKPFVLATVVSSTGSSPGKEGFKLVLDSENNTYGTVGGGAIEMEIILQSKSFLSEGIGGKVSYLLAKNSKPKTEKEKVIPMMCGGRMEVFFEVFGKKQTVFIFGGGHVGQALIPLLNNLGYYIVLVDNRQKFIDKDENKLADKRVCEDYIEYSSKFNPSKDSMCILLTHGHNYDYEILYQIYSRNIDVKYIGVISSKGKAATLKKNLKKSLGEKLDFSNLFAPIGLDIGGDSAAEIALSIAAELQSVRYNLINSAK